MIAEKAVLASAAVAVPNDMVAVGRRKGKGQEETGPFSSEASTKTNVPAPDGVGTFFIRHGAASHAAV